MKSSSEGARIIFYSLRHAFAQDQSCYFDGANGRLIKDLQERYPNDFTIVAYEDQKKRPYYSLKIVPEQLHMFPFFNSFGNGIKYMRRVINTMTRLEKEADVLVIQLPLKSYLLPFFLKKPIVYHICSNLQTAALNPVKYKGIRKWLAYAYATWMHKVNHWMLSKKNVCLIANGAELGTLYQQYKTEVVVSTSIYEKEILSPEQLKPRGTPFQFLFVGRPSLEKGFDTLLQALKIIRPKFPDIQLTCVGFDQTTFEKFWSKDDLSGLEGIIHFKGEIPFSQTLFDIYAQSDALVLPSRSEGTPRVLVEARAFGCPVIATRVGGIPTSVTHEKDGLLFEAGNENELAEKMMVFLENEPIRHNIRLNGLDTVQQMTMEKFTQTFVDSINKLISDG